MDLKSDYFDRLFMVTVIGEIENKSSYLNEIYRILKDDGMLSVSELAGDPDKLSMDELQSLVCANGFNPHSTTKTDKCSNNIDIGCFGLFFLHYIHLSNMRQLF